MTYGISYHEEAKPPNSNIGRVVGTLFIRDEPEAEIFRFLILIYWSIMIVITG